MQIGDRIKELREKRNMSQEELAKKIGYKSRSSINKIETEGRKIPQDKIKAASSALNVSPLYLLGWTDDPTPVEDGVKETVTHVAFTDSGNYEVVRFPDAIMKDDGTILDLRSLSHEEQNEIISYIEYILSKKSKK